MGSYKKILSLGSYSLTLSGTIH